MVRVLAHHVFEVVLAGDYPQVYIGHGHLEVVGGQHAPIVRVDLQTVPGLGYADIGTSPRFVAQPQAVERNAGYHRLLAPRH